MLLLDLPLPLLPLTPVYTLFHCFTLFLSVHDLNRMDRMLWEKEREREIEKEKLSKTAWIVRQRNAIFSPPSFGSIAMKSGKCYPCHSVLWFSFSILRRQTWEWKNIVSLSEVQRENKQREGDFDECQWETREEEREGIFKERNRRWNRQNEMMMMHYWWSKSLMPLHFLMMKLIVQSFNPRDFFQMQWIMLR